MEEVVVVSPEELIKKHEKRLCKLLKMLFETSTTCGGWYEGECHNETAFYAMEGAHTLISYFESLPRKRANLDTPNAHRSRWSASKGRLRKALEEFVSLHSIHQHMLSLHQLPGRMVMGGDYKGALILDFDAAGMSDKRWTAWHEGDVKATREPFIIPALFEGEEVQLALAHLPGVDNICHQTHALPDGPMGVWAVFRKVD